MAETDGVFDCVYDSHCVYFDVVIVDCMDYEVTAL